MDGQTQTSIADRYLRNRHIRQTDKSDRPAGKVCVSCLLSLFRSFFCVFVLR